MPASNQLDQNFRTFLQDVESSKKINSILHPINVVVVSKTHSLEKILELQALGQSDFAENYLNEAIIKIQALEQIKKTNQYSLKKLRAINWHFIGHLQSNKAKLAAQHFSWIHSIDSLKLAITLNKHRPIELGPINVLIQVNIQNDQNKHGIHPEMVAELAHELMKLPNLKLRGLMCILQENCTAFDQQFKAFTQLKTLYLTLNKSNLKLDTLSMGMSSDYQAAIAAGSTMIRIGSAIFGPRS